MCNFMISVHVSERSLAGAKCLKYGISDSVVFVVAQENIKAFRACGGGRAFYLILPWDFLCHEITKF